MSICTKEIAQKIELLPTVHCSRDLLNQARDEYRKVTLLYLHTLWNVILEARVRKHSDENVISFQKRKVCDRDHFVVSSASQRKPAKEVSDGGLPRKELFHLIHSPFVSTTTSRHVPQHLFHGVRERNERNTESLPSETFLKTGYQLRTEAKRAILWGKSALTERNVRQRSRSNRYEEESIVNEGHEIYHGQTHSIQVEGNTPEKTSKGSSLQEVDIYPIDEVLQQSVSLLVVEEAREQALLRFCLRALKWSTERRRLLRCEIRERAVFWRQREILSMWQSATSRRRHLKSETVHHWQRFVASRAAQRSLLLQFFCGVRDRVAAFRMVRSQRLFRLWQLWMYRLYMQKRHHELVATADQFLMKSRRSETWTYPLTVNAERTKKDSNKNVSQNLIQEEMAEKNRKWLASVPLLRTSEQSLGFYFPYCAQYAGSSHSSFAASLWRAVSEEDFFLMRKQNAACPPTTLTSASEFSDFGYPWLSKKFLYHPHYHETILLSTSSFSHPHLLGVIKALFLFWKKRVEHQLCFRLSEWIHQQRQLSVCWGRWKRKHVISLQIDATRSSTYQEPFREGTICKYLARKVEIMSRKEKAERLKCRGTPSERLSSLPLAVCINFSCRGKLKMMSRLQSLSTLQWAFDRWQVCFTLRQGDWYYLLSIRAKVLQRWRTGLRYRVWVRFERREWWAWWKRRVKAREALGAAVCWHRQNLLYRLWQLWKCETIIHRERRLQRVRLCMIHWKCKFFVSRWEHFHRILILRKNLERWFDRTEQLQRRKCIMLLADSIHKTVMQVFLFQRWRKLKLKRDRVTLKLCILSDLHDEKLQKECFFQWRRRLLFRKKEIF